MGVSDWRYQWHRYLLPDEVAVQLQCCSIKLPSHRVGRRWIMKAVVILARDVVLVLALLVQATVQHTASVMKSRRDDEIRGSCTAKRNFIMLFPVQNTHNSFHYQSKVD